MKPILSVVAVLAISLTPAAQSAEYCGDLKNAFGPFDYRNTEDRKNLPIVERAHFTSEVERLVKGNTGRIGGDLDYTLRAFPNHHRALAALANLALRDKNPRPDGARYSVDCFFERAIRFQPSDGIVRMVYGSYLSRLGNAENALKQFNEAVALEPENANINYSLGLLHFKKKNYDDARKYAKKAYSLGFPLPWLKDRLNETGNSN